VRELSDSTALAADPAGLRARLADEGYVFVRGLLPADAVAAARRGVVARLARGGWTDGSAPPGRERGAVSVREALADPAFRAALVSPDLNRLPYLPPFRRMIRSLLGAEAFSYPVKVLRAVYPERPPAITLGRYVHQDYQNSVVQDMLTTWVPLMDIPADVGGLAVLPGSNLGPPVRPRLLGQDERGWVTADYRPGDVLIFHCMTAHRPCRIGPRTCGCRPTAGGSVRTSPRPPRWCSARLASGWASRSSCSAACSGGGRGGSRFRPAWRCGHGRSWRQRARRPHPRVSSPCTRAGGAGDRPPAPSADNTGRARVSRTDW
jgi:hypothetical protein